MPIYWSKTLIPTLREVPADAEVPSHRLMLRAGLIRKLGAGIYDYLPLGVRALHKAMQIVRQEMDKAGAVEVLLPVLHPIELWEKTGRRTDYGENLFVIKDRHGREQALGPTHEEIVTELVAGYIESYRQLPITLYQIQTKFRDEYRPRFGVLRSREFQMKDAYSFDKDVEGLSKSYEAMYQAYRRIFDRCGLPYEIVEAESGPIGGSASHEFMVPSPTGEDVILKSDKGNYAANVEKCQIGPRSSDLDAVPLGQLQEVHTPNCKTIEDLVTYFKTELKSKLSITRTLKTRLYVAAFGGMSFDESKVNATAIALYEQLKYVIAVVVGDRDVNDAKVRRALGQKRPDLFSLRPAELTEAAAAGFNIGFLGPHAAVGRQDTAIVIDQDAATGGFWVTGGNKPDYHVKLFNWKRDVVDQLHPLLNFRVIHDDIRNAVDGDPSPKNDGGILQETKGIEIGHVFKLGTKYSEKLDARFLDADDRRKPMIMGCYGIGINRILAAAIERAGGNDDHGILWPAAIAPYQVIITPIKYDGELKAAADRIAGELEVHGIDVLINDRDERPGVKFNDADLIGIPLRITIGDKALKDGCVEMKARRDPGKGERVAVGEAAAKAAEMLRSL